MNLRLTQTSIFWCFTDLIVIQYMLYVSHSVFSFEEEVSHKRFAMTGHARPLGIPSEVL